MEEWRDIPGFEGLYQVSNLGRTKSFHREKERILNLSPAGSHGYLHINLHRHATVHRLVAEAFLGKPDERQEMNHKDGNKQNNTPDNLEFVTHKENMEHAVVNGLFGRYYTFGGETLGLKKWAEILDVNLKTVLTRLKKGMSIEFVMTKPIKKYNRKKSQKVYRHQEQGGIK